MKTYKSLTYFLVLVVVVSLTGCESCNPKHVENPPSIVTYEADASIPDYEKMPLRTYQTAENARLDETTARENVKHLLKYASVTNEFDLAKPVKEGEVLYFRNPNDPSAMLNVNMVNGDISLNRGTKGYMGFNSTRGLVKNEEAEKMAKEHFDKLGFAPIDKSSMVVGHVGGVNMTMHDDKEGNRIYEKLTTVRFDRMLDNIPVLGHSRLLVQMGEKGVIQSIIKQWTPLSSVAVKSDSLVSKDEVKKSIEDHLMGENKGASKIIIKKINLIYYDNGKGIIEPALHIIGLVLVPQSSKDSTLMSFKHDTVEPLLKNPRISYTFKGEDHPAARQSDAIDNNSPMPRGIDEKNKY